jgi:hypothetical protein
VGQTYLVIPSLSSTPLKRAWPHIVSFVEHNYNNPDDRGWKEGKGGVLQPTPLNKTACLVACNISAAQSRAVTRL